MRFQIANGILLIFNLNIGYSITLINEHCHFRSTLPFAPVFWHSSSLSPVLSITSRDIHLHNLIYANFNKLKCFKTTTSCLPTAQVIGTQRTGVRNRRMSGR